MSGSPRQLGQSQAAKGVTRRFGAERRHPDPAFLSDLLSPHNDYPSPPSGQHYACYLLNACMALHAPALQRHGTIRRRPRVPPQVVPRRNTQTVEPSPAENFAGDRANSANSDADMCSAARSLLTIARRAPPDAGAGCGTYSAEGTLIVGPPAMRVDVPVGGARPRRTRPG
jgi:hypothetical protein